MRILKILLLVVMCIALSIQDGKTFYAPGWTAYRLPFLANCSKVYIAGTVQPAPLRIEIQDAHSYQIVYADIVPGNYFQPARVLDFGQCSYVINLFIYPDATPNQNYLILATALTIPSTVQSAR